MNGRRTINPVPRHLLLLAGLAVACQDTVLPTEPDPVPEIAAAAQTGEEYGVLAAQSAEAIRDAVDRLAPGLGPEVVTDLVPRLADAAAGLDGGNAIAATAALDRAERLLGQGPAGAPDPDADAIRLAILAARAGLDGGEPGGL